MIQVESLAHGFGELGFIEIMCSEVDPNVFQRVLDGLLDNRVAVPVDSGRRIAKDVEILVTVNVKQPVALPAFNKDRERLSPSRQCLLGDTPKAPRTGGKLTGCESVFLVEPPGSLCVASDS